MQGVKISLDQYQAFQKLETALKDLYGPTFDVEYENIERTLHDIATKEKDTPFMVANMVCENLKSIPKPTDEQKQQIEWLNYYMLRRIIKEAI